MKEIWKFRWFFWRYRWHYAGGMLFLFLTALLMVSLPRFIKFGIDGLKMFPEASFLSWGCVSLIGLAIVQAVIRTQSRLFLLGISRRVEVDIQNVLFAHLQNMPPGFFQKFPTGDLLSRMINDIRSMRALAGPAFMYFLNAFFLYGLSFVSMVLLDPVLTFWALSPFPLIIVLVKILAKPLYGLSLKEQEQLSEISDHVQENLTGMHVVQAHSLSDFHVKQFAALCQEYLERGAALARTYALLHPSIQTGTGVAALVVLWKGGERLKSGAISYGDFAAFYVYLALMVGSSIALGWILNLIQRAASAAERLNELFEYRETLTEDPMAWKCAEHWNLNGDIEVRHLSFGFDGTGTSHALSDLSLSVNGGTVIGIVGQIGSGKSTLAKAFVRLIHTPPGTVFIGGTDITRLPLKVLRKNIGYVPQDAFMFSTTVYENIAFGRPESTMDMVHHAAATAQFDREIAAFPGGYQTLVGERGITLSGGQRQRGTIARAALVEPALLILDDAFASVDSDTEVQILSELLTRRKNRTTIIIAHRISTLRQADTIIVLESGRIEAKGRHEELLKTCPRYRRLFEIQSLEKELEKIA